MLLAAKRREFIGFGLTREFYRHGSFESLENANDLTNRTLEQNREAVEEVAQGKKDRDFVKSRFGYKTGREAIGSRDPRAEPYVRDTYGVGVEIAHDQRSPRGFTVITAYPRND